MMTEKLHTPDEAARILGGLHPGTLRNWRYYGRGPRYVKFGNRVLYAESALADWIAQHEVDPGNGSGAES